jgi:hypothetical protein
MGSFPGEVKSGLKLGCRDWELEIRDQGKEKVIITVARCTV